MNRKNRNKHKKTKTARLSEIKPGAVAYVERLETKSDMRRRLNDIGLIKGTRIECVSESPLGGICAYLVRGAVIAIRKKDCESIIITNTKRG